MVGDRGRGRGGGAGSLRWEGEGGRQALPSLQIRCHPSKQAQPSAPRGARQHTCASGPLSPQLLQVPQPPAQEVELLRIPPANVPPAETVFSGAAFPGLVKPGNE